MKKPFLIIALFAGLLTTFSVSTSASAKSKSAKVLSTRTLSKKPYHAVSGYLYTSAGLTKKAHNADNYPLTVFYTYKSDTVRKANGNKAVYYYVKNGNGKVKGWIWRGHLVRVVDTQKQLSQLNQLVDLIDSTSTNTHNKIVSLLNAVNSNTTLPMLIKNLTDLQNSLTNNSDIVKLGQIISIIQSDVSNGVNTLLNTVQTIHNVNANLTSLVNGILSRINS